MRIAGARAFSGKHLPLLGGNEQPADILLEALNMPRRDPATAKNMATLLAKLIIEGFLQVYLCEPSPGGFTPQVWRNKLSEIKKTLERKHPRLLPQTNQTEYRNSDAHDDALPEERDGPNKRKGKGIDRLAAKDRTNKVVSEIDALISKRKIEQGYLTDGEDTLKIPTKEENDDIISAEIDMFLMAA